MRLDKMTPEQRSRFEAHCAESKTKPPYACMSCGKVLLDPGAPGQLQLVPSAVRIPFFGEFCSEACAKAFERNYGILFRRDESGKVSYV
jgi:hypothetical protein